MSEDLTEEQKRIKIAAYNGITVCSGCFNQVDDTTCCCGDALDKHTGWEGHSATPQGCTCGYAKQPQYSWAGVPNYFRDLNAMHEVEKVILKTDAWDRYYYFVRGFGGSAVHAEASQRAEAFGLALKLWKEGQ